MRRTPISILLAVCFALLGVSATAFAAPKGKKAREDASESAKSADGQEWDDALDGHNRSERLAADVYTLDV